jgi:hypothetical protein
MRCAVGFNGEPEGLVVIGALAAGDAAAEGEGDAPGEGEAAALAGDGDPEAAGLAATVGLVEGGFVGEAGAAEVQPTSSSKSNSNRTTCKPGFIRNSPRAADQATVPLRHASRWR